VGPDVRRCSTLKRHFVRRAVILAAVLVLGLFALSRLGSFLVVEDPLQTSDAIIVLGGTMYERQLEAVDLYKAGMAPRIFLFREIADSGERELIARGVAILRPVDLQIDAMTKVGVPREAIGILDEANSTADEALHVRALVTAQHLSRVIIITSKQHTRRARLVMNRRLASTGVSVIIRPSRYDHSDVDAWWRNRSTLRFTLFESQRLIAYWIGLAD
jgi:uncharacterized SAM-binding protein YcdF (DUF218 family)